MNELVVRSNSVVTTYDEVERAAKAMAASGFFIDTKSISQAIVKIMAGQELGFGPFASMNGVYIIQGRPSFGANMMAAAVKASGRYNYRVVEMSDTKCEIAFFEQGQECGRSSFTIEDARKAGTKNLDKFPRNMLFARAMSNGVRWYCPDVTNGSAVYTPEELGAEVDGDGNVVVLPEAQKVVDLEYEVIDGKTMESVPTAEPDPMTVERACTFKNSKGVPYMDLTAEVLANMTIGIDKALKMPDKTDEERQIYRDKLSAIKVLIDAKNAKVIE
jgi:hypothetical protein